LGAAHGPGRKRSLFILDEVAHVKNLGLQLEDQGKLSVDVFSKLDASFLREGGVFASSVGQLLKLVFNLRMLLLVLVKKRKGYKLLR